MPTFFLVLLFIATICNHLLKRKKSSEHWMRVGSSETPSQFRALLAVTLTYTYMYIINTYIYIYIYISHSQLLLQAISRSHNAQGLEMLTVELAELTKRGAYRNFCRNFVCHQPDWPEFFCWLDSKNECLGLEEFVGICLICWRRSSHLLWIMFDVDHFWFADANGLLRTGNISYATEISKWLRRSEVQIRLSFAGGLSKKTRYRITHRMLLFLCFSTLENQDCECFMIL